MDTEFSGFSVPLEHSFEVGKESYYFSFSYCYFVLYVVANTVKLALLSRLVRQVITR